MKKSSREKNFRTCPIRARLFSLWALTARGKSRRCRGKGESCQFTCHVSNGPYRRALPAPLHPITPGGSGEK